MYCNRIMFQCVVPLFYGLFIQSCISIKPIDFISSCIHMQIRCVVAYVAHQVIFCKATFSRVYSNDYTHSLNGFAWRISQCAPVNSPRTRSIYQSLFHVTNYSLNTWLIWFWDQYEIIHHVWDRSQCLIWAMLLWKKKRVDTKHM